jgi:hypothetical protein
VLNSLVGSSFANQYSITAPWTCTSSSPSSCQSFSGLWGTRATVAQALRPYPQYTYIDTYAGQGDHSGHSTDNAFYLKFEKRLSHGLTFQSSYSLSKLLTNADTAWGEGYAADQFNRGLEKSIGAYEVTHDFKFAGVYDLPFGKVGRILLPVRPPGFLEIGGSPASKCATPAALLPSAAPSRCRSTPAARVDECRFM